MASTKELDELKKKMEDTKTEANKAFEKHKYSAAAELYTSALAFAPATVPSELKTLISILFTNRAMCYRHQEKWKEMEEDAQKALVDRLNPKAHYLLGLAASTRSEWTTAVRAMETALEMAKRQKKPLSLLREFEAAIAKTRHSWHQASLAEDRELDAVLFSGLQDALDVKRDAEIARLNSSNSSNSSSGSSSSTTSAAMPTITEAEEDDVVVVDDADGEAMDTAPAPAPASFAGAAAGPAASSRPTLVRPGSAMPSSGRGEPSPSSPSSSPSSSSRPKSAGAAFARRVTGIFKTAAETMKRRASVRYDSSSLVDDAAVKGISSSTAAAAEAEAPGAATPSAASIATASTHSSSATSTATSSTTTNSIGDFDATKPILAQHAEFSAQLSEVFAEREKKRRKGSPPDWAVCPITFDVMLDPVISPASGQSYERSALERYLRSGKSEDPSNRKPLRVEQLVSNLALKQAIETWLHKNPGHHPLLPDADRTADDE